MGRTARTLTAGLVTTGLLLAACTQAPDEPPGDGLDATLPTITAEPLTPWPSPEWATADDGRDYAELDAAAARTASLCVTVVRDGRVVHRWTAPGAGTTSTRQVYSVTKSVTALLVAVRRRHRCAAPGEHLGP